MMYGVEEAIEAGITFEAPVLFVTRSVINPDVLEADEPVMVQPFPATVEVAVQASTISPETTPVTAQSIGTVVDAATVND